MKSRLNMFELKRQTTQKRWCQHIAPMPKDQIRYEIDCKISIYNNYSVTVFEFEYSSLQFHHFLFVFGWHSKHLHFAWTRNTTENIENTAFRHCKRAKFWSIMRCRLLSDCLNSPISPFDLNEPGIQKTILSQCLSLRFLCLFGFCARIGVYDLLFCCVQLFVPK